MKKSELFMKEMLETFTCHPYAVAPIRYGEGVTLSDVYGSYSVAKERAYNACSKLCDRFNGCIMLAFITRDYKHLYFV